MEIYTYAISWYIKPERLIIDFKIIFRDPNFKKYEVLVGTSNGEVECIRPKFIEADMNKLISDWRKHKIRTNNAIIECYFDPKIGWRIAMHSKLTIGYELLRFDKNTPNYITTAFEAISAVAENLTTDEIARNLR